MRVDGERNRRLVLAAAGRLFDEATNPDDVTMDAVAVAAGVGKGTVFRGFGDRAGLVRELFQARADAELSDIGPDGSSAPDRVAALLSRMWMFKRRHRVLSLALEQEGRGSPYQSPTYGRWHTELTAILQTSGSEDADFLAHVLLAAVRSDLVEYLHSNDTDVPRGLGVLAHSLLPCS